MPSANPPRVAYIVKRYPRYSETFIVNEILAHEEAGLSVEIYSLYPPNDTHFQDLVSRVRAPVHYLPAVGVKAADLWAALQGAGAELPGFWPGLKAVGDEQPVEVYQAALLARDVSRKGITHLHAHFGTTATTVARLASRFSGVPYSFTAHAKDIFHEDVVYDDLRRKIGDAKAVITVSEFNLEYLRQRFGGVADGVTRVYNGLPLDRFQYQAPRNRQRWIVAVGRLVEKKGFSDLVLACRVLADRGQDFSCKIIGTGPLESDLRFLIEKSGLEGKVELLGPRPQAEVRALVQAAAVFVAPSVAAADGNREGLPTVLLEAMALGTPCVATGETGIPEVVHDEETGLLVPPSSPGAIASAVERILGDDDLSIRMTDQARRLIEREFDITQNTGILRSIFNSPVDSSRSVPQEACT